MPESEDKFEDISILDNRKRGSVGEYLTEKIKSDAKLSFVSAYSTIYAYQKLKKQLDEVDHLRFLFGEPSFIKSLGGKIIISEKLSSRELERQIDSSIFERAMLGNLKHSTVLREVHPTIDYPIPEIKFLLRQTNLLKEKLHLLAVISS